MLHQLQALAIGLLRPAPLNPGFSPQASDLIFPTKVNSGDLMHAHAGFSCSSVGGPLDRHCASHHAAPDEAEPSLYELFVVWILQCRLLHAHSCSCLLRLFCVAQRPRPGTLLLVLPQARSSKRSALQCRWRSVSQGLPSYSRRFHQTAPLWWPSRIPSPLMPVRLSWQGLQALMMGRSLLFVCWSVAAWPGRP